MTASEEQLVQARQDADRARDRLTADLIALQDWLMPRRLFGRMARQAGETGSQALNAGADAVKARPGLLIGAAALGALLLARKPIARALSRESSETERKPARSTAKPSPARRPRARPPQTRKAKP